MSKPDVPRPGPSEDPIAEGRRLRLEAQQLRQKFQQLHAHVRWLAESIRRRWQPDFHQPLQRAIRALHQCESEHVASFAVRKVSDGEMVWEGTVEEFRLQGHLEAKRCYAWHYVSEGKLQSFSVLKLPPVDTPQRAVQMALAAKELGPKLAGMLPEPMEKLEAPKGRQKAKGKRANPAK